MEEKTTKYKNYIILGLILIIGILFMFKTCKPVPIKTEYQDNIITEHHYDTIYHKDTIIKFKTIFYPKVDSVIKIQYKVDSNLCHFERIYNDTLRNSQLDIYNRSKVIGLLETNSISYKLKVPIIIKDSIIVTKTVVHPNKVNLYGIVGIDGGMSYLNGRCGLGMNLNNKFLGVYYMPFSRGIGIDVGLKLWGSKK